MRTRFSSKLFLSSFVWLLSACSSITLPNTPVCTVSGVMSAGADCAYTNSDATYSLNLDQWLEFLTPQPAKPDPANPGQTIPARGGALCLPSEGWAGFKTALEQACSKIGRACTPEVKTGLQQLSTRVESLQARANWNK